MVSGGIHLSDVRTAQSRERQLDAISTILVLALLVTLGLVFYLLWVEGIQLPGESPIAQYTPRVLLGGFTILLGLAPFAVPLGELGPPMSFHRS